jgi:hypothetical protein
MGNKEVKLLLLGKKQMNFFSSIMSEKIRKIISPAFLQFIKKYQGKLPKRHLPRKGLPWVLLFTISVLILMNTPSLQMHTSVLQN